MSSTEQVGHRVALCLVVFSPANPLSRNEDCGAVWGGTQLMHTLYQEVDTAGGETGVSQLPDLGLEV